MKTSANLLLGLLLMSTQTQTTCHLTKVPQHSVIALTCLLQAKKIWAQVHRLLCIHTHNIVCSNMSHTMHFTQWDPQYYISP